MSAWLLLLISTAAAQTGGLSGSVPGWRFEGSNRQNYEIGLDSEIRHTGQYSASVRCREGNCGGFGAFAQGIRAAGFADQRVRLTAWVKTKNAGRANIWMQIDATSSTNAVVDLATWRPLKGNSEWRKQEIVLDVPSGAQAIHFGLTLAGSGQAWADDFALQIVNKRGKPTDRSFKRFLATPVVPVTRMLGLPAFPENPDFEDNKYAGSAPVAAEFTPPPKPAPILRPALTGIVPGWKLTGSNPQAYEVGLDKDTRVSGNRSGTIRCRGVACTGYGALMQSMRADALRNRRVRLSGWVKCAAAGRANLWMRVDGSRSEVLAFDNMSKAPQGGNSGWLRQEIVLDVPESAATVYFGLVLVGGGQAWVDDILLVFVSPDVAGTNTLATPQLPNPSVPEVDTAGMPTSPVNLDFEKL